MILMKKTLTLIAFSVAVIGIANAASAQEGQLEFDLFQNFYTAPGASMATAELYNAPHPVPYNVGSSFYTYQPFYPHQHLYSHTKNYYNYYGTSDQFYSDNLRNGQGGDALNKTTVIWKNTGHHFGHLPMGTRFAQKLQYGMQSRKYGLNGDLGRRPRRAGAGNCY